VAILNLWKDASVVRVHADDCFRYDGPQFQLVCPTLERFTHGHADARLRTHVLPSIRRRWKSLN